MDGKMWKNRLYEAVQFAWHLNEMGKLLLCTEVLKSHAYFR